MNRLLGFLVILITIQWLTGCQNSKQIAYFQDLKDTSKVQVVPQHPYEPLKLMVDDQVQITISSTSPEAAQFFNLAAATTGQTTVSTGAATGGVSSPAQNNISVYTVSNTGNITLPVIGDMHVIDLTTEQVKQNVIEKVAPYLKDAIVSVKLVNFKVTVIGEVGRPVNLPISGERFTVLEAIGASGDMTVYAHRYNVKVMRNGPEGVEVAHLNFNTSKILQSPFYQLKQNDIVYVEPAKSKGFRSESIAVIVPVMASFVSLLLSITTIFLSLK